MQAALCLSLSGAALAAPANNPRSVAPAAFPFAMPAGSRRTSWNFMANCHNFINAVAKGSDAGAARGLCEAKDGALCDAWSVDLPQLIEAKKTGKEGHQTYNHWCEAVRAGRDPQAVVAAAQLTKEEVEHMLEHESEAKAGRAGERQQVTLGRVVESAAAKHQMVKAAATQAKDLRSKAEAARARAAAAAAEAEDKMSVADMLKQLSEKAKREVAERLAKQTEAHHKRKEETRALQALIAKPEPKEHHKALIAKPAPKAHHKAFATRSLEQDKDIDIYQLHHRVYEPTYTEADGSVRGEVSLHAAKEAEEAAVEAEAPATPATPADVPAVEHEVPKAHVTPVHDETDDVKMEEMVNMLKTRRQHGPVRKDAPAVAKAPEHKAKHHGWDDILKTEDKMDAQLLAKEKAGEDKASVERNKRAWSVPLPHRHVRGGEYVQKATNSETTESTLEEARHAAGHAMEALYEDVSGLFHRVV